VEPRTDDDADWDSGPGNTFGPPGAPGAAAARPALARQTSAATSAASPATPPAPAPAVVPAAESQAHSLVAPAAAAITPDTPKPAGGSAMRWVVLAVFLAVGVVAFLATR